MQYLQWNNELMYLYINPGCPKLFYFEITCKYQDILENISYNFTHTEINRWIRNSPINYCYIISKYKLNMH